MRWLAVALALAAAAACVKGKEDSQAAPTAKPVVNPPAPPAPAPPAVVIDSVASAQAAVGKLVRIDGLGDNAKLGAVVVKDDLLVYCSDRPDGWDERNQPVIVEGVLEVVAAGPPTMAPDGTASAGVTGPRFRMVCTVVP